MNGSVYRRQVNPGFVNANRWNMASLGTVVL